MKKPLLVLLFLGIFVGILAYFFNIKQMSGNSMEPTLHNKQFVVISRSTGNLERADIVFYHPFTNDRLRIDTSQTFVGRVVALPKEQYRVKNGQVYLKSGVLYKLNEEYIPSGTKTVDTYGGDWLYVNEYVYLVWGDNRSGLKDSNSADRLIYKNQIFGELLTKI